MVLPWMEHVSGVVDTFRLGRHVVQSWQACDSGMVETWFRRDRNMDHAWASSGSDVAVMWFWHGRNLIQA